MKQILFEIEGTGIRLYGFGVMFCIAMLASMYLAALRARRYRLDPDNVLDLAFWVFIGGLIGARLFFVIQYRANFRSFWEIFEIWKGGIVLYGGVIGGSLGGMIYWWRRRFPLLAMWDLVAPSIALGIALGRIGCFLNGCCYGDRCDAPWAVSFPVESIPWWDQVREELPPQFAGIPLDRIPIEQIEQTLTEHPELRGGSYHIHPTQLYSAIDGFVLLILLLAFAPVRRRDGEVIALLMLAYPIDRFLIEQLRNDEKVAAFGMTISQGISVLILAVGVLLWAWLLTRPAKRWSDQAGAIEEREAPLPRQAEPSAT
jgi:phosphatidylglycerol:prolipoprotein diacylglycerol transferase